MQTFGGVRMTAELTSEEIVTRLLTSNQIIKPKKGNFYISNPAMNTLGDYLLDMPVEIKTPELKSAESLKYRFIKGA